MLRTLLSGWMKTISCRSIPSCRWIRCISLSPSSKAQLGGSWVSSSWGSLLLVLPLPRRVVTNSSWQVISRCAIIWWFQELAWLLCACVQSHCLWICRAWMRPPRHRECWVQVAAVIQNWRALGLHTGRCEIPLGYSKVQFRDCWFQGVVTVYPEMCWTIVEYWFHGLFLGVL